MRRYSLKYTPTLINSYVSKKARNSQNGDRKDRLIFRKGSMMILRSSYCRQMAQPYQYRQKPIKLILFMHRPGIRTVQSMKPAIMQAAEEIQPIKKKGRFSVLAFLSFIPRSVYPFQNMLISHVFKKSTSSRSVFLVFIYFFRIILVNFSIKSHERLSVRESVCNLCSPYIPLRLK